MYYIYHVPGVKVGCTTQPSKRVKDQGYSEYQILEAHEDIYKASEREREIQKQMGYHVDKHPYYHSKQNRRPWSKEDMSKGGKTSGNNAVKSGQLASIRSKENSSKGGKVGGKIISSIPRTCPYCNITSNGIGYTRWHGENCKKKIKI